MTTVSIKDGKNRFTELVREAERGKTITVTRNGDPVCEMVPLRKKRRRELGSWRAVLARAGHRHSVQKCVAGFRYAAAGRFPAEALAPKEAGSSEVRLLLDSNIVVPLTRRELHKLQPRVLALLESVDNEIYVSAVSLWEIAIKVRLGKLDPLLPVQEIPDYVTGLGFHLLGMSPRHATEELAEIPEPRDPFDQMLLAQCQAEGLRLVTTDPGLLEHPLAWRAVVQIGMTTRCADTHQH
jgi:prevent-host-death family protein